MEMHLISPCLTWYFYVQLQEGKGRVNMIFSPVAATLVGNTIQRVDTGTKGFTSLGVEQGVETF